MPRSVPYDPEQLRVQAMDEFAGLAQRRSQILEGQVDRVLRWDWYTDAALHPLPLHFHLSVYGFPLGSLMKKEPKQESNRVLYGLDAAERPVIERAYMKPSTLGYHEEAWVYEADRVLLYGFDYNGGSPVRATVAWQEDGRIVADAWHGARADGARLYEYDHQELPTTVRLVTAEPGEPLAPHSTFRAEYNGGALIRVTQYDDRPDPAMEYEVVFPSKGYE